MQAGPVQMRIGASYGWDKISITRSVAFQGFNDRASSKYNGRTAQAFGELGYKVALGASNMEPFANLTYIHVHTDAFTEQGGAASLSGDEANKGTTLGTLGVRGTTPLSGGKTRVTLDGALAYRHAFGAVAPTVNTSFVTGGGAMTISGAPLSKGSALVKAGISAALSDRVSIGASYIGQFGDHSQNNGGQARLLIAF